MEISKSKNDLIKAGIICIVITLIFAFSIFPFYYGFLLGGFAAFFSLIRKESKPNSKKEKIIPIGLLIFTPFLMFLLTELLSENNISVFFHSSALILNLFFFYAIELIILFATQKYNLTITIYTLLFLLLGIINSYIVVFRGYSFSMSDFYFAETALNVADEYSYQLNENQLLVILTALIYLYVANKYSLKMNNKKLRIIGTSIMSVFLAMLIVLSSCTTFLKTMLITPTFAYEHHNGLYINLLGQIQVLNEDKTPEGYSTDEVNNILANIDKTEAAQVEKPVNIICIMNEALADLTIYEKFDVGYDPLEYIHSLTENTITGYTYASVFGGATVVSEYEFLSNSTALFFGGKIMPYSILVDESSHSIVKQLKEYGYYSTAIHPYKKVSYNRPFAYECLGFDAQLYETDLRNENFNYSDSYLYQIIQQQTQKDGNQFIFTVTMQNHSPFTLLDEIGFTFNNTDYGETISRYISLVQESDKAFKELVEYYSNCDEPTIILMFGDHQPMLEFDFTEKMENKSLSAMLADPNQEIYKTPFIIWANYDIYLLMVSP